MLNGYHRADVKLASREHLTVAVALSEATKTSNWLRFQRELAQ